MAITPQTELKLLKVPILINNKNQITFANKEAQFNYFNSLPKIEEDNFTYQRHDSVIRFPAHIDEILEYNYCIYQNENYSNKWFYAFITNMTYINDSMTEISITTDVFQTWQFDIIFKQSFVEREMLNVADDVPRCQFNSRRFGTWRNESYGKSFSSRVRGRLLCCIYRRFY